MRIACLMLSLAVAAPAFAQSARQIGPFQLGMTASQLRSVAAREGLRVRPEVEQQRDLMGLGLMNVMPVHGTSNEAAPQKDKLWTVTAYLLAGRVAYLHLDYGQESPRRAAGWFERFDAPSNVRDEVQDTTWSADGVIIHADRFGRSLYAVDWAGLKSSDRALVGEDGAVRVANEYFRRLESKRAEAAVEHLRQQVVSYYDKLRPGEDAEGCVPPPSTQYTPGENACDLPEKRFPEESDKWKEAPWSTLGVDPQHLSRRYSYVIESSGKGRNTRITILAVGDLDCDERVSTVRVLLRPDRNAPSNTCRLGEGQWEVANPLE